MTAKWPLRFVLVLGVTATRAAGPAVTIDTASPLGKVSPLFYGLMTEEINFSYDGGLYAELIRDRAIGPGRRPLFYWTHVARGESVVDVDLDDHAGPSAALPRRGSSAALRSNNVNAASTPNEAGAGPGPSDPTVLPAP